MKRYFYRVGTDSAQGLWYDKTGSFTGLIHTEFDFCTNSKLLMPFDQELIGFLSVADSVEHLFQWFTKEDILRLQEHGFAILQYSADDWKFYSPFHHNVISQETSILETKLKLI